MIEPRVWGDFPGLESPASPDRMPATVTRYVEDRDALLRRYPEPGSASRFERLEHFHRSWLDGVSEVGRLDTPDDRVDLHLFRLHLESELANLSRDRERRRRVEAHLPLVRILHTLESDRHDRKSPDFAEVAKQLDQGATALESASSDGTPWSACPSDALRARQYLGEASSALSRWWEFHDQFHPQASWWCARPVDRARKALESAADRLESATDDGLSGDPIGPEALEEALRRHQIDATSDALLEAARSEMERCMGWLRDAAKSMGCASVEAAIERVKESHGAPGSQPGLVSNLACEAIDWVRSRELVDVPALAVETWRMTMMSSESQRTNPFFLGGECIFVSYPTRDMDDARKRMSLRGNNPAFSRATVQHELIPGHHLQQFHERRFRSYRALFATPFWIEGWTLHWELLLWDLGFPRTAEERIGMLFWRMHRCARILFSIAFHSGRMTGRQCVDFLVERAFHERANAEAEVRRSLSDAYDPLYQLAYLTGGWQVRALHRECRAVGWSDRGFHDAFLRANQMPIRSLRCLLMDRTEAEDLAAPWDFPKV